MVIIVVSLLCVTLHVLHGLITDVIDVRTQLCDVVIFVIEIFTFRHLAD